jgi:hypothetical protein
MAEAGFEIIETGPYGYFPTDPKELQKWCDEFGMRVVAFLPSLSWVHLLGVIREPHTPLVGADPNGQLGVFVHSLIGALQ